MSNFLTYRVYIGSYYFNHEKGSFYRSQIPDKDYIGVIITKLDENILYPYIKVILENTINEIIEYKTYCDSIVDCICWVDKMINLDYSTKCKLLSKCLKIV